MFSANLDLLRLKALQMIYEGKAISILGMFFLGASVLVELNWLLRTVGGMNRTQISLAFASLLGLPTACVQNEPHVRWAVERFATQGDLADLLHLGNSTDADAFVTFDKRLARQAGANAPLRVEVLT